MNTENEHYVDEDAESWINLMYCRDAAKTDPELRKLLAERLSPEVLKAVDECSSYENFKQRMELHKTEDAK